MCICTLGRSTSLCFFFILQYVSATVCRPCVGCGLLSYNPRLAALLLYHVETVVLTGRLDACASYTSVLHNDVCLAYGPGAAYGYTLRTLYENCSLCVLNTHMASRLLTHFVLFNPAHSQAFITSLSELHCCILSKSVFLSSTTSSKWFLPRPSLLLLVSLQRQTLQ